MFRFASPTELSGLFGRRVQNAGTASYPSDALRQGGALRHSLAIEETPCQHAGAGCVGNTRAGNLGTCVFEKRSYGHCGARISDQGNAEIHCSAFERSQLFGPWTNDGALPVFGFSRRLFLATSSGARGPKV